VVLDTIEALFSGLPNHAVLRAELRRLFRWLKDRGVTAIITGERGEQSLTRYGLEEYVADCVILLDHRIVDQVSTRRLRVVKYRGTAHGTNEYPFLIGAQRHLGAADHVDAARPPGLVERVSTGIDGLDDMLGGAGVYRGSSTLVSGAPGTGKSSVGASFVDAACRRGERALLFAYEESSSQLMRNMRVDRHRSRAVGAPGPAAHRRVAPDAARPRAAPRAHVRPGARHQAVGGGGRSDQQPDDGHDDRSLKPTLMRLIDYLKQQGVTALFTSLTSDSASTSPIRRWACRR
jgi:circadian clock protein KaiC